MKRNVNGNGAFTLIELSIVIAVLSALIFGAVIGGRVLIDNAYVTSLMADVKTMEKNLLLFKTIYGDFPGRLSASQITSSDNLACDSGGTSTSCYNLNSTLSATPNGSSADAIAELFRAKMVNILNVPVSSSSPISVDVVGYLGNNRSFVISSGGLDGVFKPNISGANGDLSIREAISTSYMFTVFKSAI